ncbi:unnamed protein product [Staurois parvus]|uniref:Uncharacterized protein n=1 Tax=Staurois parvus TaxID=386267 RepID=A0ABN9CSX5_9NEOB|nr:unnamed protein product [Staurois parvus]
MYVHTHKRTHTQTHVHTHTCTYTQTHVQIHTCTYTQTHTHTPIKSCSASLLHLQSWVLQSRGRQRAQQHSFLCFHFAQLLSSLTAPSASGRSGPEFQACSARRPWGHTRPPP